MSDSWRSLWMVCLLAWMPTTQLSVKAAHESPTRRMERSTFATIIGLNTLSSKCPLLPPTVTATWFPITGSSLTFSFLCPISGLVRTWRAGQVTPNAVCLYEVSSYISKIPVPCTYVPQTVYYVRFLMCKITTDMLYFISRRPQPAFQQQNGKTEPQVLPSYSDS
jgi:hypothetical protein